MKNKYGNSLNEGKIMEMVEEENSIDSVKDGEDDVDDREYLGVKGNDLYYVDFEIGEDNIIKSAVIYDAIGDELNKLDNIKDNNINFLDSIVTEIGLDSISYQVLLKYGIIQVADEIKDDEVDVEDNEVDTEEIENKKEEDIGEEDIENENTEYDEIKDDKSKSIYKKGYKDLNTVQKKIIDKIIKLNDEYTNEGKMSNTINVDTTEITAEEAGKETDGSNPGEEGAVDTEFKVDINEDSKEFAIDILLKILKAIKDKKYDHAIRVTNTGLKLLGYEGLEESNIKKGDIVIDNKLNKKVTVLDVYEKDGNIMVDIVDDSVIYTRSLEDIDIK
jgi:hypothetical protein